MREIAGDWARLRPLLETALELESAEREAWLDTLEDRSAAEELRALLSDTVTTETTSPTGPGIAAKLLEPTVESGFEPEESRVGQRAGRYRLERLLGVGGMGAVYLAKSVRGQGREQVALKIVRKSLLEPSNRIRFLRERHILAELQHPCIATLFEVGRTADDDLFYTMEYIEGSDIVEYCSAHALPVRARVELLLQVASALAYAHANLIVHRDIKPQNVLIGRGGAVKLVDFGLAKPLASRRYNSDATETGCLPMTLAYAAPEQFRPDAASTTVATDIYQFGMLCYRVLAGCMPYRTDPSDALAWRRAVQEEDPVLLRKAFGETHRDYAGARRMAQHLSSDLDAILRKALAKAQDHRYPTVDAMIKDLQAYLDGRPVSAKRAGVAYFTWRFVARHARSLSAAAVVLALGAVVATNVMTRVSELQSAVQNEEEVRRETGTFFLDFFTDLPSTSAEQDPIATMLDYAHARLGDDKRSRRAQAAILLTLARANLAVARRAQAIVLIDEAIADLNSVRDPDALMPLAELEALRALICLDAGDLDAAKRTEAEASRLLRSATPGLTRERFRALLAFGDYFTRSGDYAKGQSALTEALAIGAQHYRTDSPEMLNARYLTLNNLRNQWQMDLARPRSEALLSDMQRVYGPDDPRTIAEALQLNRTRVLNGDYDQAQQFYLHDLENMPAWKGSFKSYRRHADLFDLGELYRFRGQYGRADASLGDSLDAIAAFEPGPGMHWMTDAAYVLQFYVDLGDEARSIALRRELQQRIATLAPSDARLELTAAVAIADADRGEGTQADENVLQDAIALYQRKYGYRSFPEAAALTALGRLRWLHKDAAGAAQALDQVPEFPSHGLSFLSERLVAKAAFTSAEIAEAQGRASQALALLADTSKQLALAVGAEHPLAAESRLREAAVRQRAGLPADNDSATAIAIVRANYAKSSTVRHLAETLVHGSR